jgi:hypothetical protein
MVSALDNVERAAFLSTSSCRMGHQVEVAANRFNAIMFLVWFGSREEFPECTPEHFLKGV